MPEMILVLKYANPIVLPGPRARYLARFVRGTIIQNDEFKIRKCLTKNTANGKVDEAPSIMNRHYDADFGLAHIFPLITFGPPKLLLWRRESKPVAQL